MIIVARPLDEIQARFNLYPLECLGVRFNAIFLNLGSDLSEGFHFLKVTLPRLRVHLPGFLTIYSQSPSTERAFHFPSVHVVFHQQRGLAIRPILAADQQPS